MRIVMIVTADALARSRNTRESAQLLHHPHLPSARAVHPAPSCIADAYVPVVNGRIMQLCCSRVGYAGGREELRGNGKVLGQETEKVS